MADAPLFRAAIGPLIPYEPGKPVEEVQRELGLERVVKLASNEGQFGPFPEALEAIARGAPELNRYPDGGAYGLRTALAEKHDVEFENVAVAAGADPVGMYPPLPVLHPHRPLICFIAVAPRLCLLLVCVGCWIACRALQLMPLRLLLLLLLLLLRLRWGCLGRRDGTLQRAHPCIAAQGIHVCACEPAWST